MAQDRYSAETGLIDAIVASATTPGRSALAVVRIAGRDSCIVSARLLGPRPLTPRRASPRTAHRDGEPIDRVVAVYWPQAESPLGEDMVELTCHGSPDIVADLVAAAISAGARPAEPGEFTRRAYTNGKMDLSQAEGVEALISAHGRRARRAALDRLDGGLSRRVAAVRLPLRELTALVEARLDHPDEDIPGLTSSGADAAISTVLLPLERLASAHERRPRADGVWRVCLLGAANAGKSSLLNAIVGRDRSIVSDRPGTTRDTVEDRANLGGLAAAVIDTAGFGIAPVEEADREAQARSERAAAASDVCVLVVDAAAADTPESRASRERVEAIAAREARPLIVAYNKCDLLNDRTSLVGGLAVSAKTGENIEALCRSAAEAAGAAEGGVEDVLVTARDHAALTAAATEIGAARQAVAEYPSAWEDRAARHLRDADAALASILGERAGDDILDEVFSRFCLGK